MKDLVIVGGGMAAHRLVEAMLDRDEPWRITVLAEESRAPYDRVALTSYFTGRDPDDLVLGDPALWQDHRVDLQRGCAATAIDRSAQRVTVADGRTFGYDALVLATGSRPFVPPIKGADLPGCFVYRTLDDVAQLRGWVEQCREESGNHRLRGAVIGGGLLGLEAAGALRELQVDTTVVELAPHLMAVQVDPGGGEALKRLIGALDIDVRTGVATRGVGGGRRRRVSSLSFEEGPALDVDVVIFATGVRPEDSLARSAGLAVGPRGGLLVDEACRTEDAHVYAIGEVAAMAGQCYGLVAPAYAMAEVVADRLTGGDATFPGADTATKLKLLGVDVASFGDAFATAEGSLEVVFADPVGGVYKKLVLSPDGRTLLGGILVGDAQAYSALRPMVGRALETDPAAFLLPEGSSPAPSGALPDEAVVCSCNNVTAATIRGAVTTGDCADLACVKSCTKAGTSCGSCVPLVKKLTDAALVAAGGTVNRAMCEHFDLTRAELFAAVRVTGMRTFAEIIARHGRGGGCDICKPVIASILATLGSGHVLDPANASLQDTNDHVMANIQRDGSYSVVPRIPGGEITPEGLIAIGEVAREFGLYTKITGGQRIDLFGARIDQLPAVWQRLVDAGFESGHAYGKSLRTVKSCVGSTWCRYGVQDSVGMAIALELRYRGLRAPHKIKLAVSGCARECAEARSKDVGVIATDKGWNVYVGGNGGFTPRHAVLLAEDLDDSTLVRTIDRFLMYYAFTADRLQRTAPWVAEHEGGIDAIRAVIMDDSLGICAELDAAIAAHVDAYTDEWRAALEDPERMRHFRSFLNAPDTPDPSLTYVTERGQSVPPTRSGPVVIAGPTVEVRR
ncbi:MAG: nitrite reductase large subunit NirB [Candidatus Nanopelagicales bacterium]|nr:nitrite reductase large subunit NirB [Candidatus Nanopelagicales bacterium]